MPADDSPENVSFASVLFFTYAGDTCAPVAAGGSSEYVTVSFGLYTAYDERLPKNTAYPGEAVMFFNATPLSDAVPLATPFT